MNIKILSSAFRARHDRKGRLTVVGEIRYDNYENDKNDNYSDKGNAMQ